MQHHIYLLSSLIISFYILTTNFLCYIFSKGHTMAHHGGCCTPDIFLKWGYFYAVLISSLFSKMADNQEIWDSDLLVFSSYFKSWYLILINCMPKCSKLSRGMAVWRSLRNIRELLWRSHFNSECQTMCSGMLRPRQLLTYFRHNSFCFFHFRTHSRRVVLREVADREVVDREVEE